MPNVGTKMKKEKKLPKKFYLTVAAGILITAAVLVLNSSEHKRETETNQNTADAMQTESEETAPYKALGIELEEEESKSQGSKVVAGGEELDGWRLPEPDMATGPGAVLDFDEYYWGGKRYTGITVGYLTDDMEWRDFAELENAESMKETMGADYGGVAILLESYLEQHGLKADMATVLLDRYAGISYGREEYYIQFNDKEETLVTFLYYPPQGEHGAYLDVLPCQYTSNELVKLRDNAF